MLEINVDNDPTVRAFLRVAAPLLGLLVAVGTAFLASSVWHSIGSPGHKAPLDNPGGGVILLLFALGLLIIAFRLFTGSRRDDGGMLPPSVIAVASAAFLAVPIVFFRLGGDIHFIIASSAVWLAVAYGFKVAKTPVGNTA